MKKSEFLEAVKDRTIKVEYHALQPCENGRRVMVGLPEEVQSVHVNQIYAWLKEEFQPELREHPDLKAEQDRYNRFEDCEDETGRRDPDTTESKEWVDWYEQHPDEIFHC